MGVGRQDLEDCGGSPKAAGVLIRELPEWIRDRRAFALQRNDAVLLQPT